MPDLAAFLGDELAHLARAIGFAGESWRRDAACREVPSALFFLQRGEDASPAKRVCAACPVRRECLEYAMAADASLQGVWAGTSVKERRSLRVQYPHGLPDVLPEVRIVTGADKMRRASEYLDRLRNAG